MVLEKIEEMTRRRSRLEIYLEVLETIMSGYNKPTNIMYKCNLSWMTLKEVLDLLVERGLITTVEKNSKKLYLITEKGRNIVSQLQEIYDLLFNANNLDFHLYNQSEIQLGKKFNQ